MDFKYSDLRKQVLADQYKIKNFTCDKNWPLALEAWKETEYVQDRENGNDDNTNGGL